MNLKTVHTKEMKNIFNLKVSPSFAGISLYENLIC